MTCDIVAVVSDPVLVFPPQVAVLRGPHEPRRPVRHRALLPRPHHWRAAGEWSSVTACSIHVEYIRDLPHLNLIVHIQSFV